MELTVLGTYSIDLPGHEEAGQACSINNAQKKSRTEFGDKNRNAVLDQHWRTKGRHSWDYNEHLAAS
jgi:hypothetical protein